MNRNKMDDVKSQEKRRKSHITLNAILSCLVSMKTELQSTNAQLAEMEETMKCTSAQLIELQETVKDLREMLEQEDERRKNRMIRTKEPFKFQPSRTAGPL